MPKQNSCSPQNQITHKLSKINLKITFWTAGIILLIVLILSGIMVASSYQDLKNAIQKERAEYVQEISAQIIISQRFMEKEYSNTVRTYAGILNSCKQTTLAAVSNYFSGVDKTKILMVSTQGDIIDLNGKRVFLGNRSAAKQLYSSTDVAQVFASLDNSNDYWLFSYPIDTLKLDDVSYSHVIFTVPSEEFRDNLSISLFDHRGASYIIKNDGSISIKPKKENGDFAGYNLFESLRHIGAEENELAALQATIESGQLGSFITKTKNEGTWLINCAPIDDQNALVVTVPLTITAAETYQGLNGTIISVVAAVLSMAILGILMIMIFFYRDRQRHRAAVAVSAKNDFFSKMSHDIRTPLNAVIGLELLALENVNRPDEVKDYLTKSSAAASYLLSIINDVLDMSRIESGKLTIASLPFDMNQVLCDIAVIVSPMATDKSLHFSMNVDKAFETNYLGDQVRIKQILMNLLSNATKFTKEGGHIWLTATHAARADGYDAITLTISDDGIGMSKEYLNRIFTPFEQERSSLISTSTGSGLGLSIVHNLVELMNGTIAVESVIDKGTTFTIVLPFKRGEKAMPIQKTAAASIVKFTGKQVLLAEDNAINQQVAVAILTQKFDFSTVVASNGMQAVEEFAASSIGQFSLILMDVKMPIMDGLEATRRIRALTRADAKTVPIVALSANAFEEDIALSLSAGMNAHLSKPIRIAELSAMLEKTIEMEENET